jgi:hypothetical protein
MVIIIIMDKREENFCTYFVFLIFSEIFTTTFLNLLLKYIYQFGINTPLTTIQTIILEQLSV